MDRLRVVPPYGKSFLHLLSWRHNGFSAHGAVRVDDRGTRPQ
jgi:hypothetical protein